LPSQTPEPKTKEGRDVPVKVEFVPVGRNRREWMWKARNDSNTITISGHRFESLSDAMRDACEQFDVGAPPEPVDDGPFAA
jgi:hypothetical protein